MLTEIRYPIRFGGQPNTTDRYKTVIVSYPHRHEVPEISGKEAETVADFGGYRLLAHGGRLFRRVCSRADYPHHASVANAFECTEDRHRPVPAEHYFGTAPRRLGAGIWNRIVHRLYVEDAGRGKEEIAWPNAPFNNTRRDRWTRDGFRYEDMAARLIETDVREFEAGRAEHRREAERLLWIGDALWVETTPPAICVASHVGFDPDYCCSMELAFVPEWLDPSLDRQYFAIGAFDEAMAYARSFSARVGMPYGKLRGGAGWSIKERVSNPLRGVEPGGILSFDHASYYVNRMTMLLASEVSRAMRLEPAVAAGITEEEVRDVEGALADAAELGPSVSDWPDQRERAVNVVEAWFATGRRQGWTELPAGKRALAELFRKRIHETVEDMPVTLTTAAPERMAP